VTRDDDDEGSNGGGDDNADDGGDDADGARVVITDKHGIAAGDKHGSSDVARPRRRRGGRGRAKR
jgi:hypothetical protein